MMPLFSALYQRKKIKLWHRSITEKFHLLTLSMAFIQTTVSKNSSSYYKMGQQAGFYLRKKIGESPASILWLPGPREAGWVQDGDRGFKDAIRGSNIKILGLLYGDTGRVTQKKLLEEFDLNSKKIDYIVGTALQQKPLLIC